MVLRKLLDSLNASGSRRPGQRRVFQERLQIEALEDRSLPSRYILSDLGTLGGDYSQATDINSVGQVVGNSTTAANALQHPVLWTNGAIIDLGTLGGPSGGAVAINDLGQVLGRAAADDGTDNAFLLTPEDTNSDGRPDRWFRDVNGDGANDLMTALPRPAGAVQVSAIDINAGGQVVGYFTDAGGNLHATLWSAGTLTDLGTLVGLNSAATGINNAGQVVGYSVDEQGRHHPFLWDIAHGKSDLGIPVSDGWATSITAAGVVVGNANGGGFVWTPSVPNGVEGTLAFLGESTAVSDANDTGLVIGAESYYVPPGDNDGPYGPPPGYWVTFPVLWQNGTPAELNSLLQGYSGIAVDSALGINDVGQIVGVGSYSGYGQRAILLTPDTIPSLSVNNVSVVEGNAGTKSVTFTVTLSAPSTQQVTVNYATANGTATAGSDYLTASGTLTFAPGETSKNITVLVKGDRTPESDETFVVNLSGSTNAPIASGAGYGRIVDEEPRISVSDVTKAEGKKGKTTLFTFTVTLSTPYDQPVTMSFRTVNGTATTGDGDYVAKTGAVTFKPGETTKTITIEVKGDNKKETEEYFYLDLSGNSSNSLFTKNRGVGTIINDD